MNPNKQKNAFSSPWSLWTHLLLICWRLNWLFLCSWTPKFLNLWRLAILKVFGAKIYGLPFVDGSVRIQIPWHLKLHHRACLGEKVNAYSIGYIEVKEGATVAQESYLCTGTHDFKSPTMQLISRDIIIGKNAFIGARAMVLPGVKISNNSIVGAQAVVTKNIPNNEVFAGNPAKKIGEHKNFREPN